MDVTFRTDASLHIGIGHVMRCLTLADALRERGAHCTFISRKHPGNILLQIEHSGHKVIALAPGDVSPVAVEESSHAFWLGTTWEQDAAQTKQILQGRITDWLVVDHYALDLRWEKDVRDTARRIMVIDDLADRPHNCDLLLDQNLGRSVEDYSGLLNDKTVKLIGPPYALLRSEFHQWRPYSLARRAKGQLKTLLITMGGVDKYNATGQVLASLAKCKLVADIRITVVMGLTAPWLTQVRYLAEQMPWSTQVLVGVSNMGQLMAESDLAIGAAGTTSLERCYLGLPTLLFAIAANQQGICTALAEAGAGIPLKLEKIDQTLPGVLAQLQSTQKLCRLSKAAANVTTGCGAYFVANKLKAIYENHITL